MTPRVKRVIDVSQEEANRLKDEYISTETSFPGDPIGDPDRDGPHPQGCGYHQRAR